VLQATPDGRPLAVVWAERLDSRVSCIDDIDHAPIVDDQPLGMVVCEALDQRGLSARCLRVDHVTTPRTDGEQRQRRAHTPACHCLSHGSPPSAIVGQYG